MKTSRRGILGMFLTVPALAAFAKIPAPSRKPEPVPEPEPRVLPEQINNWQLLREPCHCYTATTAMYYPIRKWPVEPR